MIKSWAELEIAWSELVPTLLKEDDFNKYTTQLQPECMSSVTHQIAAYMWLQEFKRTGDIHKLDEAITLYERAMDQASKGFWTSPKKSIISSLFSSNLDTSLPSHLDTGLKGSSDLDDKALQAHHVHQRNQAILLSNLADMLADRYEFTRSMEDLGRSIQLLEEALISTVDAVNQALVLNQLSEMLIIRHGSGTPSLEDIDRAINLATRALKASTRRASVLNNLGSALSFRYTSTGSAADLDHAIAAFGKVLHILSEDHFEANSVNRGKFLANYQFVLGLQFEKSGSMQDLDRATEIYNISIDICESTRSRVADRARLNRFAIDPQDNFDGIGSMEDLNHSIETYDKALTISSIQQPQRIFLMHNLGDGLVQRFIRFGSTSDLERSIVLADEALELLPFEDVHRRTILNNLGSWLIRRSDANGSVEDLDRAIEVTGEALGLYPKNHRDRSLCLSLFAGILRKRHMMTGSIEDLDHAIEAASEALDATQPLHANSGRLSQLKELKYLLSYRSARTGSIAVINQSVEVNDELVKLIPTDNSHHVPYLADLGEALFIRFEHTNSTEDLDRAIRTVEEAIQLTPLDHPMRALWLDKLVAFLSRQFKYTRSIVDIDRAVVLAKDALTATKSDSPHRLKALNILGSTLIAKFVQTQCIDDLKLFFPIFKDNWDCPKAPPSRRILSAEMVVYLLDFDSDWEGSSTLMQTAVQLLPFVSPRSLKHADRQHQLKIHNGLPSRATAYALRDHRSASDALRTLDFGRGIIASFLMDLRGDVSDLEKEHPKLAAEFIQLRDRLDTPSDDTTSWESSNALYLESEQKKRREADKRLGEVLEEIRAQPGLSHFLLPLSEESVKAAATPGPLIVVTVDSFRGDAFLVKSHEIKVLNLPNLTLDDVEKYVRHIQASHHSPCFMTSMLEWLWDTVAGPCLNALGYNSPIHDDVWPRVWWIPTGPLSHLPLHAAGRHTRGSIDTVLDRVVSSYASSVKALVHGRQQASQMSQKPRDGSALLVTMQNTPNRSQLHFAMKETSVLESLCQPLQLKPIRLRQQTRNEVLGQIRASTVFHFAGHGFSDPSEPSQSSLLLEDWQKSPLTMGHLRDLHLSQTGPFLAYLSACSTGANKAKNLDDEGINIVGACQLAGFRHVIGALWEVSDPACVDVARMVYETLRDDGMTDAAVARGLHRATKALRDRAVNRGPTTGQSTGVSSKVAVASREGRKGTLINPGKRTRELVNLFWIPYVHYGI